MRGAKQQDATTLQLSSYQLLNLEQSHVIFRVMALWGGVAWTWCSIMTNKLNLLLIKKKVCHKSIIPNNLIYMLNNNIKLALWERYENFFVRIKFVIFFSVSYKSIVPFCQKLFFENTNGL